MNEKTKADLDAFRHERTKQWTLSDDPHTIIEPVLDKDCPMCRHENEVTATHGNIPQFNCRACGWWYT